jgi:hypothetical protein
MGATYLLSGCHADFQEESQCGRGGVFLHASVLLNRMSLIGHGRETILNFLFSSNSKNPGASTLGYEDCIYRYVFVEGHLDFI